MSTSSPTQELVQEIMKEFKYKRNGARGHIIAQKWLRKTQIPENLIEYGVLKIVASYTSWNEFQWDNYDHALNTLSKDQKTITTKGLTPSHPARIPHTRPAYIPSPMANKEKTQTGGTRGAQIASCNVPMPPNSGIYHLKVLHSMYASSCSSQMGICSTSKLYGKEVNWSHLKEGNVFYGYESNFRAFKDSPKYEMVQKGGSDYKQWEKGQILEWIVDSNNAKVRIILDGELRYICDIKPNLTYFLGLKFSAWGKQQFQIIDE